MLWVISLCCLMEVSLVWLSGLVLSSCVLRDVVVLFLCLFLLWMYVLFYRLLRWKCISGCCLGLLMLMQCWMRFLVLVFEILMLKQWQLGFLVGLISVVMVYVRKGCVWWLFWIGILWICWMQLMFEVWRLKYDFLLDVVFMVNFYREEVEIYQFYVCGERCVILWWVDKVKVFVIRDWWLFVDGCGVSWFGYVVGIVM